MPTRYPYEAALRDGRRVLVRPFTQADVKELVAFFQRMPPDVRRFAWDRVDDPGVVQSWAENIDHAKAFPLVALDGGRIVADATLHRRRGGPLRLVGRVKWMLDPAFRGVGLGELLVRQFVDIARASGLRHLSCMLMSDLEADAIEVLRGIGFEPRVVAGYGTDPDGGQHDMTHLVLKL